MTCEKVEWVENGDISDKTKTSVLKMQLNAWKGTKRSGRVGKEWKSNAFSHGQQSKEVSTRRVLFRE